MPDAGEQSPPETAWKAIVKTYLSLENCDHVEDGCPLPALAPELARADKAKRPRIFEELKKYRGRMLPFMPGRRIADKERAFFSIFATMVGRLKSPEAARTRDAREGAGQRKRTFIAELLISGSPLAGQDDTGVSQPNCLLCCAYSEDALRSIHQSSRSVVWQPLTLSGRSPL
jgi:hypothetical protein